MLTKRKGLVCSILATVIALAGSFIVAAPAGAESAPAAPSGVRVTATANNTFRVTWRDNSSNETGFEITDGISYRQVGANGTADVWNVTPGTYKCFRVKAFNSAGSSEWKPSKSPYYRCATTPQ
jgi:hypothetical protein